MSRIRLPALGLLAACSTTTTEPPDPEALAACEEQSLGDSDFDWDCCQIWQQECNAEKGNDCEWICNG